MSCSLRCNSDELDRQQLQQETSVLHLCYDARQPLAVLSIFHSSVLRVRVFGQHFGRRADPDRHQCLQEGIGRHSINGRNPFCTTLLGCIGSEA
jgi:hypothetical protein